MIEIAFAEAGLSRIQEACCSAFQDSNDPFPIFPLGQLFHFNLRASAYLT